MEIINTKNTGMIQIAAQSIKIILKIKFVCGLIRFNLDIESSISRVFAIPSSYMIALSLSIFFTSAFASKIVIQHATDWKNVTAEVIPTGVFD